jgi:hypothetical protein
LQQEGYTVKSVETDDDAMAIMEKSAIRPRFAGQKVSPASETN